MIHSRLSQFLIPLAALTLASVAAAQVGPAAFPFSIRVQQGTTVSSATDGALITMAADAVGIANTAVVSITYTGTTTNPTTAMNAIDLTGSTDFSISGLSELPVNLLPKQSFALNIVYKPTSSAKNAGKIVFTYVEAGKIAAFTLNLAGTAPEFAYSYIPQGGNAALLGPGGKIVFPVTGIDEVSAATFVLTNRGSGPGNVAAVKVAGDGFGLAGLPLPNTAVEAGKELRFTVNFTAAQIDVVSGALTLDLPLGRVAFGLEGSGSGPILVYETGREANPKPLEPGQLISFPAADVGDKSTVRIRVLNQGNADARITNISVTGASFTLTDAPFVPYILTPDSSVTLTVTFTPTQTGKVTGRLRIGSESFELTGSGLASVMAYEYTVGSTTTTVSNNGSVIFTPVAVGKSATAKFVVSNTGNSPASVSSINIAASGTSTVWSLSGLPALPASVPAGKAISFTITFAPSTTGTATAALKVDTQSFTLSGSGNPPPALPDYRFDGASGPQEALQQPAVGLLLSSPYPLALTGTLALTFNSDVAVTDPAVQFAIGGKSVNFTIPANSTRAVFSNGAQQIKLQTGSVAGTISLTPSFVSDGGIVLTPTNPPALNLTIAPSAPKLLSVQVTSKTNTGFSLLVTGYATGRSVSQIDVQFTPTSGENVQTSKLTLNTEANFLAWYANATSQPFGSLFTATLPFTLSGDVTEVTSLVDTVRSVTVTLSNKQGASQAMSVNLK